MGFTKKKEKRKKIQEKKGRGKMDDMTGNMLVTAETGSLLGVHSVFEIFHHES